MKGSASFGFKTVSSDEKESLVRGVFDSVAPRYDLMNDLMSGGLHRLWKREMVNWLHPREGMSIIDVAGGTGDVATRIRAKAKCDVTLVDINEHMLMEGRDRSIDHNTPDLHWVCGNAEALPLPDSSYDAYTIAFGIRNVTNIDKALAEAFRVLKPGGRFLCLEFSQVHHDVLRKMYDAYSFYIIPQIGKMVTGDAEAYQYLVESIRRFPDQDAFAEALKVAGFGNVQYRNLTQGVVAIHSGRKF